MRQIVDEVPVAIRGRIEIIDQADQRVVACLDNLVVDQAFTDLLPQIVGRDPNAVIGIISIGTGGNYNQAGVLIGTRVPPANDDTTMRVELFRAGIVQINFPGPGQVEFVGLLRQNEAVSSQIDEFGLLSMDGRMFSHAINPDTGPATPTVPYVKPLGAIYAVRWTLTFARC